MQDEELKKDLKSIKISMILAVLLGILAVIIEIAR